MDYVGATSGHVFTLGQNLAEAGEGALYFVRNRPGVLAKILHNPPTDPAVRKLIALVGWKKKPAGVAFPIELLLDPASRQPAGLLIPFYPDAVPVAELLDPAGRAPRGFGGDLIDLVSLAVLVCRQVEAVHRARLVIGDLTPANLLAGLKNGRLTGATYVIDTNSFHVVRRGPQGTEVFLTGVATERYAAPEVQAADWATSDRTVWTDAYALALILWQLLLGGSHPFDLVTPVGEDPPPMGDRIRDGMWPYGPVRPLRAGWRQVTADPPFGTLPPGIQDLFRRTFHDGHAADRTRAAPADWVKELAAWERDLRPTIVRKVMAFVGRRASRIGFGGRHLPNVRVPGWAGAVAAAVLFAFLPTVWPEAASAPSPDARIRVMVPVPHSFEPPQSLVPVPSAAEPSRRLPPPDPTLFPPELLGAFGVKENPREAGR